MKFTQEIKDKWITALESGNYIQTKGQLVKVINNTPHYCCLGVFGDVISGVSNIPKENSMTPYQFFGNCGINYSQIWMMNDDTFNPEEPNYLNVIDLIKSLPVNE